MSRVRKDELFLRPLIEIVQSRSVFGGDRRIVRTLNEEDGDRSTGKVRSDVGIRKVFSGHETVNEFQRAEQRGSLQQAFRLGVAAVFDDELHLRTDLITHFHDAGSAEREAVKDDLQRLFRARFQILDPFQRVRAFKKIEPDDLTVTFSVRGVVRGEDVEAAAVPVIEDHAGCFGVFGTVAVNDEGDPAAVRIFTGLK